MNPAAEATASFVPIGAQAGARRAAAKRAKVVGDELVMDRFRLLERIGSGGMGTVYRAFDERLQRQVAVKEVDGGEPERVAARGPGGGAAQPPRRSSPCTSSASATGTRAAGLRAGPGRDLAALPATATLSDRDVAEIGADLCEALAHAHARGVVHRDVKPQNVIVRDDQRRGPAREADGLRDRPPRRRADADRAPARSSARSPTCRPSRPRASSPGPSPTSTRSR